MAQEASDELARLIREAEEREEAEALRATISSLVDRIVTLPPRDATYEEVITEHAPEGWSEIFTRSLPELRRIGEILKRKYQDRYYPLTCDLFNAFHYCRLEDVKVVIFGQDPYHQPLGDRPRAQGMSFSVAPEDEIPFSLRMIYSELERSFPWFSRPNHGSLIRWAKQGVLLLNACLTVEPGKPLSHEQCLWMPFISRVLTAIFSRGRETIFLLWGSAARAMKSEIKTNGIILETCHPAARGDFRFVGCGHFATVNTLLRKQGRTPVDWSL